MMMLLMMMIHDPNHTTLTITPTITLNQTLTLTLNPKTDSKLNSNFGPWLQRCRGNGNDSPRSFLAIKI